MDMSDADGSGLSDAEVRDALPEDLDARGLVGPYVFPDNDRRRIPGMIYLLLAATTVVVTMLSEGSPLVDGGLYVGAAGLALLGAYHLQAGWSLGTDEADALAQEIAAFVKCVRTREIPAVNGEAGRDAVQASVDGVMAVARPVFASAITTVLAFSPMFALAGMPGKVTWYIPAVVIIALGLSLGMQHDKEPGRAVAVIGDAGSGMTWTEGVVLADEGIMKKLYLKAEAEQQKDQE